MSRSWPGKRAIQKYLGPCDFYEAVLEEEDVLAHFDSVRLLVSKLLELAKERK